MANEADQQRKGEPLRVLAPIDGSAYSERIIDYLLTQQSPGKAVELHLLNVQSPLRSGHARMFIDAADIESWRQEEGLAELKTAREKLDAAGVDYAWHIAVGPAAQTIVQFARENAVDHIVMGTRGRSALPGLLMGSVARDVSRLAGIPVTLVK